jgi:hypothetical protein
MSMVAEQEGAADEAVLADGSMSPHRAGIDVGRELRRAGGWRNDRNGEREPTGKAANEAGSGAGTHALKRS